MAKSINADLKSDERMQKHFDDGEVSIVTISSAGMQPPSEIVRICDRVLELSKNLTLEIDVNLNETEIVYMSHAFYPNADIWCSDLMIWKRSFPGITTFTVWLANSKYYILLRSFEQVLLKIRAVDQQLVAACLK